MCVVRCVDQSKNCQQTHTPVVGRSCVDMTHMLSYLSSVIYLLPRCSAPQRAAVLQCTAVWCSVVQCVAVCCRVLQSVAVFAVCCNVLQCVAMCRSALHVCRQSFIFCQSFVNLLSHHTVVQCVAVCCSVLQCAACLSSVVCLSSHCSPLQCAAVLQCTAVLQCVVVYCSMLQGVGSPSKEKKRCDESPWKKTGDSSREEEKERERVGC